jgi:hypothetical protein
MGENEYVGWERVFLLSIISPSQDYDAIHEMVGGMDVAWPLYAFGRHRKTSDEGQAKIKPIQMEALRCRNDERLNSFVDGR